MLESLILDENNPKLHRAGSGHVINWVLKLKIIFLARLQLPYQKGTNEQRIKTQFT